ncbi:ATP-binding protein [Actinoplanes sp. DH11]|uniref:ATP-binding protein n=1 Tax=Actinoplanes sp. DH11 TaxID=2857011 RepID=UPI001E323891|nr:ATP-binding protein [Actinoplanes sp. DH11]
MPTVPFTTTLDPVLYFQGLARQELDFHAALGELVDNAFSAREEKFGTLLNTTIEINIVQLDEGSVRVTIADPGIGIPYKDITERVFNLGGQGASRGQLNEHGFGLKNALALLTGGNATTFELLTRSAVDAHLGPDQFLRVNGPLSTTMNVEDSATRNDWEKGLTVLGSAATGTKISVVVPWKYFRTIYRRGTPGLDVLVTRLGEHLGVMHRYFLKENKIRISYQGLGGDTIHRVVQPIEIPFEGEEKTITRDIVVNGKVHKFVYRRGTLDYSVKDPEAEEEKGWPYPLRSYYQGSNARCGVDFVVRDRVIKTSVFEEIWPEIAKTVDFNRFIGELRVGNDFRTTNNKTGLDPHADNWEQLLKALGDVEFRPEKATRSDSEKSLRDRLVHILKGTFPAASVVHERKVWAGSVAIDIFVDDGETNRRVYELKVTSGRVLDLYQLLAGWDGLVREGIQPTVGILVVKEYSQTLLDATTEANTRKDAKGVPYNIELRTIDALVPSL